MSFYYLNVRRKKKRKKKELWANLWRFFQKSKVITFWWHCGFVGKSFYFKWNSLPCSYWPFLWLCRTLLLFCYCWNIISNSFYSCVNCWCIKSTKISNGKRIGWRNSFIQCHLIASLFAHDVMLLLALRRSLLMYCAEKVVISLESALVGVSRLSHFDCKTLSSTCCGAWLISWCCQSRLPTRI